MPESPQDKLRLPPEPPEEMFAPASVDYAELDVATNFSFLRGASHPDELVLQAARLGHRAIAVTDLNTLAGAVRMFDAARQIAKTGWGPKLIVGARLAFADAPDVLAWAPDRAAYAKLCRLLTLGRRRAPKGECTLYLDDFLGHGDGLLAALVPSYGPPDSRPFLETVNAIKPLRDALGSDRLSLVVTKNYGGDDETRVRNLLALARRFDVPPVATNAVHYHEPARRPLQDILTCVRHQCTIRAAGFRLFANGERYLKPPEQMHRLFAEHPAALWRTMEIAERCTFSLDELRYEYPDEVVPPGETAIGHLTELSWAGAAERYPNGVPRKVRDLIRKELDFVARMKFEAYFLTVYDVVKFARSKGILCQGRGSAANSAICYCLGVTSVDPAKIDVLFERFLSAARGEPPDIDVDFEHERREEVIQYIYGKYGRERAGMTATVITYRGRSAVRDVGKALGLGLDVVDQLAKRLDWWHRGTLNDEQLKESGVDPNDPTVRALIGLTAQLLGFPRHLSQHTGGMVMTRGPLCEMVPIENASMDDRTVIEWDKDDIDAVGMLKVDVLALGMLTVISKGFNMLEGLRDKGTEGLREGGGRAGEGADVPRPGGVAARDGLGPRNLPAHPADAAGGTFRAGGAGVAGGVLHSVEQRGRVRAAESEGLPEVLADRARVTCGTVDAIRIGNQFEDRPTEPGSTVATGGGRSHPPVPDHELGEKISCGSTGAEAFTCRHTRLIHNPQSLGPSVPQSLPPPIPRPLAIHTLPDGDPAVYDMICDADTVGVFQIESRAQMSMLPRLQPRCFYDIVIEVAIVRPGPIQGNMVHPYLQRREMIRAGRDADIVYESEELRQTLAHTLGVPLFQEQAMRVVMVAAGFSAEDADKLRRAMASWRKNGVIDTFYPKIIHGMLNRGYTREFAERVFEQIRGFGEYGFPESHAASFAILVYASAWIKRHHPAVFCAALLNSQPMGFYAPAQIVIDARAHGVEVRGVDVNESEWDCTLEEGTGQREKGLRDEGTKGRSETSRAPSPQSLSPSVPPSLPHDKSTWGLHGPAVRLGFRRIKGMREAHANVIVDIRKHCGRFASVEQMHRLTGLPVSVMRRLAEADAFASLGLARREALWHVMRLSDEALPLWECAGGGGGDEDVPVALPAMPIGQEVMTDYATGGLSLKAHPVALIREQLKARRIITSAELAKLDRGWVRVAGLVLIRQRPGTASGIVFETLEDETGVVNLIVRPDIYDKFRPAARYAGLLECHGYVERQGKVVHVMAKRLFDLSPLLSGYQLESRDFH